MKRVTDPVLLAQLNEENVPGKLVTDPALLAQLESKYVADPTTGMTGGQKYLAGAGKAFIDIGRGIQQITPPGTSLGAPGLTVDVGQPLMEAELPDYALEKQGAKELQERIKESRRLDQPLMQTGAGMAGNLTGNIAALAPTAFIPGANTYTGAALIGAGAGALAPTTEEESRPMNMGLGMASGLIGQGLGRLAGRVMRPVAPSLNPEQMNLARAASQEGIPLRASQITGSKPLAITESVMENLPLTSGSQIAKKMAQKQAFTAAALRRTGATGNVASPEILATQKAALGQTFEDIAGRNAIDFNQGVTAKLAEVANDASRRLAKPGPITNTIDDILNDVNPQGMLAGSKYQGWRETLGRMAKGNDSEAYYAGEVKKTLDQAFTSQISGGDAQAWKEASRQYGNLKNILQAMGGAGADQLAGNIPPSQLAQALTRQVGKEGKALGRGDLNQLTKVGRAFVTENLPDSYTAQRQFYTNLLTGGAGAIPGAGLGGMMGYAEGGPQGAIKGAGYGALGGAALTMGGPKLAQSIMNSPLGQAYLTRGLIPLSQTQRDILAQALRLSATAASQQALANP